MSFISKIKSDPKLKSFILWTISPRRNPRPRLWVRWFLNPFIHKRGKGSTIRRRSRIDVFPWNRFEIGDLTTIEDFTTVNNGSGAVNTGGAKFTLGASQSWVNNSASTLTCLLYTSDAADE